MTCHPCWLKNELDSSLLTLTAVDKRLSCRPQLYWFLLWCVQFLLCWKMLCRPWKRQMEKSTGVLHEHFLSQNSFSYFTSDSCVFVFLSVLLSLVRSWKRLMSYVYFAPIKVEQYLNQNPMTAAGLFAYVSRWLSGKPDDTSRNSDCPAIISSLVNWLTDKRGYRDLIIINY